MFLDDTYKPRCDGAGALRDKLLGISDDPRGERASDCGVGEFYTSWGLRDKPLSMVYSVLQDFDGLYDREKALLRGTLFEALDLPFVGSSSTSCGGCER